MLTGLLFTLKMQFAFEASTFEIDNGYAPPPMLEVAICKSLETK